MIAPQYDVVVVGAGCAGLSAAIGLARAGFAVVVVEAAPFAGAGNWSGCVYFTENLAEPDLLGPEGVEALAWERRLVERGLFATDGHGLLGLTYRDHDAFRHCYTVLRPVFDQHLAAVAAGHGVAFLTGTTAETLIREAGRVVGVSTQRGPLYADLVFLAEGDAAYLLTREGYERSSDPRDAPRFLLGLKQVIDLPPGAVEERFGVGAEEGVAYEILLRNGTLNGRPVPLNMGGFVYTNRQGLSVGLVLPADNLHQHFRGDPALLLDWFQDLPALRPWLRDGVRATAGAKLIRGGGARDVPHLVDDGLAVGGAASAIGTDFPFPNFIGPATAMGLLLARAAVRIRAEGGRFTRDALRQHYLGPLHQTHYWHDVVFLRRWPGYVKRTRVFFHRTLDLALGSAYVWTRPRRWLPAKLVHWVRLLLHEGIPGRWAEMQADLGRLGWALRVRDVVGRVPLGKLLLEGALNAFRDFLRLPRVGLPAAGTVQVYYHAAGPDGGRVPGPARRWFARFAPVLAASLRGLYRNDTVPLSTKLRDGARLLLRQLNLFDVIAVAGLMLAAAVTSTFLSVVRGLRRRRPRRRAPVPRGGPVKDHVLAVRRHTDLAGTLSLLGGGEPQLAGVVLRAAPASPIHVLWPRSLPDKNAIVSQGLWHVCPARVFEARFGPLGQAQVLVHFERCIQCEACWRTSRLVDWGRDGRQQVLYHVRTPAPSADTAGLPAPARPHTTDPWAALVRQLAERLAGEGEGPHKRQDQGEPARLRCLLNQLERKLEEFDGALADGGPVVDRTRADHLEMLARYVHQLALRVVEGLGGSAWAESWSPGVAAVSREMLALAAELAATAEKRSRRTWDGHYAWAAGDGRLLRQHHLAGLGRLLELLDPGGQPASPASACLLADEGVARVPAIAELAVCARELCRRALDHAKSQVECAGLFEDERGRDTISKFGAVKGLLAEAAARRSLIETLAHGRAHPRELLLALARDALGGLAVCVRRVMAVTGPLAEDVRTLLTTAQAYRLAPTPSVAVYRAHGARLLRTWQPDGSGLAGIEGESGYWKEITQRKAVLAEWDELQRLTESVVARVNDWSRTVGPEAPDDVFAEALGRLDAYLAGGKALLLHTHARLEAGRGAEVEVGLLRVWLDEVLMRLGDLTAHAQHRPDPPWLHDARPLVEPDAGPPPPDLAAFRAAAAAYESGDFLVAPVDLLQPRLVPEMVADAAAFLPGDLRDTEGPVFLFAACSERWRQALDVTTTPTLLTAVARLGEWLVQVQALGGELPGWASWRVQEMVEEHFIAEALAFDVIGLCLHPGTRSVRLESVLARIVVDDILERAWENAAEVAVLSGGSPMAGRVPEEGGADIIWRMYVLQQFAERVLPRWARAERAAGPRHLGREALELEALKAAFRQRLEDAAATFGAGLWQDPSLQVGFFALAETAAWLKAADSTLGRVAWLVRSVRAEHEDTPSPPIDLGRRAFARCDARARERLHAFDEELIPLRRGYYAPHIHAASLLLDRATG